MASWQPCRTDFTTRHFRFYYQDSSLAALVAFPLSLFPSSLSNNFLANAAAMAATFSSHSSRDKSSTNPPASISKQNIPVHPVDNRITPLGISNKGTARGDGNGTVVDGAKKVACNVRPTTRSRGQVVARCLRALETRNLCRN